MTSLPEGRSIDAMPLWAIDLGIPPISTVFATEMQEILRASVFFSTGA